MVSSYDVNLCILVPPTSQYSRSKRKLPAYRRRTKYCPQTSSNASEANSEKKGSTDERHSDNTFGSSHDGRQDSSQESGTKTSDSDRDAMEETPLRHYSESPAPEKTENSLSIKSMYPRTVRYFERLPGNTSLSDFGVFKSLHQKRWLGPVEGSRNYLP